MKCKNCGKDIPDDAVLCPYCGALVNSNNFQQNIPNVTTMQQNNKPKKKTGCLGTAVIIIIALFFFIFVVPGCMSGYNKAKTEDKVQNNASQYTEDEYKKKCESVSYDTIMRDSNAMEGKFLKFTGTILQEIEDGKYRLGVNDDNDAIVIDYSGERLLEDDTVTIYGESIGFVEYETVLKKRMKVPEIKVVYLENNKSKAETKSIKPESSKPE